MTRLTVTAAAGSNIAYTWNLGDGTVVNGAVLMHTYPAVGPYTAWVTASNGTNQLTTITDITIKDVPIGGLQAHNDDPPPLSSSTTLSVTVTAGSNITYIWTLGDRARGTGAVQTHTYPAVEVYTAVVTTSNSASSSQAVMVVKWPYAIYLPLI